MTELSKLKQFGIKAQNLDDENFHDCIEYSNLKKGMGVTIGNAVRRTLLSDVPGYAMRSIKLSGVSHEFTSLAGVKEDVQELIMNLKKIVFSGNVQSSRAIVQLHEGEIDASEFSCANLSIVNPDVYICTVEKGFSLKLEIVIERGVGIKLVEKQSGYSAEVGSIMIDSFFNPVESVNFSVIEDEASGNEDLKIDILTNGSITPKEAFISSLNLLSEQFNKNDVEKVETASNTEVTTTDESLNPALFLEVSNLSAEFSIRILGCFNMLGIIYIGDLVRWSEKDLLKAKNFSAGSLEVVETFLGTKGLKLGMEIAWPPENLAAKAKEIAEKLVL